MIDLRAGDKTVTDSLGATLETDSLEERGLAHDRQSKASAIIWFTELKRDGLVGTDSR